MYARTSPGSRVRRDRQSGITSLPHNPTEMPSCGPYVVYLGRGGVCARETVTCGPCRQLRRPQRMDGLAFARHVLARLDANMWREQGPAPRYIRAPAKNSTSSSALGSDRQTRRFDACGRSCECPLQPHHACTRPLPLSPARVRRALVRGSIAASKTPSSLLVISNTPPMENSLAGVRPKGSARRGQQDGSGPW